MCAMAAFEVIRVAGSEAEGLRGGGGHIAAEVRDGGAGMGMDGVG